MTDKEFLQYEPMLNKIANKFKNNSYGIDMDDIKQIGSLGMIRAYETYQEGKEASFSTHIYNCINWAIKNEFHNLKRIHTQYEFTSLDHEIDEDTNIYDIIPNDSINVEGEVIEELTLLEYIQEFKRILTTTKADVFIDRYINELQIKDIAAKYDKTESAIKSMLNQSRSELIRKSFRIRKEYQRYMREKEARVSCYNSPLNKVYAEEYIKETYMKLGRLEKKQIREDNDFISYYRG